MVNLIFSFEFKTGKQLILYKIVTWITFNVVKHTSAKRYYYIKLVRHWTPKPVIISCIRSSPTGGNSFLLLLNPLMPIHCIAIFVWTVKNSSNGNFSNISEFIITFDRLGMSSQITVIWSIHKEKQLLNVIYTVTCRIGSLISHHQCKPLSSYLIIAEFIAWNHFKWMDIIFMHKNNQSMLSGKAKQSQKTK